MFHTNDQGLRRSPRRQSLPASGQPSGWATASKRKAVNITSTIPLAVPDRLNGRNIGDNNTISFGSRPIVFEGDNRRSRNSLVPGRSILKQRTNINDDNTVIGVMRATAPVDDGDTTEFKRRRVSFAPKATTYKWNLSQEESTSTPPSISPKKSSKKNSPKKNSPAKKSPTKKSPSKSFAKFPLLTNPPALSKSPGNLLMDDNDSNSDMQMDDGTIFGIKSPAKNIPSQISLFGKNSHSPLPSNDILINLDSPIRTVPQKSLQSSKSFDDEMELTSVFNGSRFNKENEQPNSKDENYKSPNRRFTFSSMDMTTTVGKVLQSNNDKVNNENNDNENNTMDLTKPASSLLISNDSFAMDMTKPVGSLVTNGDFDNTMDLTKPASGFLISNDSFAMDMTKPVGRMINDGGSDLNSNYVNMDITKSVGNILINDQANDSFAMDMTKPVGKVANSKLDSNNNQSFSMDVTKSVGKILSENSGNDSFSMDMTKPVGHLISDKEDTSNISMDITKAVGGFNDVGGLNDSFSMDITKPVGRVIHDNDNTANISMDITKAVGGLQNIPTIDTKPSQTMYNNEGNENMDLSTTFGAVQYDEEITMEATKVMGGILSKPSDISMDITQPLNNLRVTDDMEVTKPIGKIFQDSKSIIPMTPMKVLNSRIISMSPEKPRARTPLLRERKELLNPTFNTNNASLNATTTITTTNDSNNISLNDFLSMISIDFMDKFLSNSRGHSSFGISDTPVEEATELDYLIAAQKLPLLNMYDFGAHELKNDIKKAKEYFAQWEESVMEDNPILFQEYADASPETKQIMKSQFLLLKNYSRQEAKGAWYDWRGQLTVGLNKDLEKNKRLLDEDLEFLSKERARVEEENGNVEKRYNELKSSIEELKKKNKELSNCDKEGLINLRKNVEIVKNQINESKQSLSKATKQRESLQTSIDTLRSEKQNIQEKIQESEVIRQKNRIIDNQEITLLYKKLKFLSHCLGISECKFDDSSLIISFKNGLIIYIRLQDGVITTELNDKSSLDEFFKYYIDTYTKQKQEENTSKKTIIMKINEIWNNCIVIKKAIELIKLQFITSTSVDKNTNQLCITMELLLEDKNQRRRKPCQISFNIQIADTSILNYPYCQSTTAVSVIFGNLGGTEILQQIQKGINSSLESEGIAGLSQICLEILEDFKL